MVDAAVWSVAMYCKAKFRGQGLVATDKESQSSHRQQVMLCDLAPKLFLIGE